VDPQLVRNGIRSNVARLFQSFPAGKCEKKIRPPTKYSIQIKFQTEENSLLLYKI
jgi:hypothetical protein